MSVVAVAAMSSMAMASDRSAWAGAKGVAPVQGNTAVSVASESVSLVVDLAGYTAEGGFGNAANTLEAFDIGPESLVVAVDYDITFEALGFSWGSELVLSVNDSAFTNFWDVTALTVGGANNAPGVFSIASSFVEPGLFGSGPFAVDTDGVLLVNVYDTFNDADTDAIIRSGTLTVHYIPIPEPTTLGLLAGAAVLGLRRRA
jgi:hypothetical protein